MGKEIFKFASINRVQYQLYLENFLNARMPASPTTRDFVLIRDRTNLKLSLDCPKKLLIDADDF